MPKPLKPKKEPRVDLDANEIEANEIIDRAEIDDFYDVANWRRTKTGNLTRMWDDVWRITIFRRYGHFRWSIYDTTDELSEPRYSQEQYETEEMAMTGLYDEVRC